ncbi:hypothetical protein AQUCO_07200163v1 [Aquilegia coerulea]|uniref:WEB family protein n=1 Tax=Aquilegia coerulea TaxID=218851 RepID=A0A2G5CBR8_AQUCA|nr:hypothetical protein AQUCO_07200163v1 [Aquilegia coerulea]
MTNRAEIDTRAPFQSVKEAVSLFGERVLAGEVYANKLKQMKSAANVNGNGTSRSLGNVTAELEETKENLEKARKDSMLMANCLSTLKEELEHTKKELQQLKARDAEKERIYSDMEDLKFIEQSTKVEVKPPVINKEETKYEDKKYVKFANPPLLAQVMSPEYSEEVLERHPTLMKKKKKTPLIPLIGGIFSKKKGIQVRAP